VPSASALTAWAARANAASATTTSVRSLFRTGELPSNGSVRLRPRTEISGIV
jgi:hypothetical protein